MLTDDEETRFRAVLHAYPPEDRILLLAVFDVRHRLRGMAKAKAHWIMACCVEGQPKIGWRDDAQQVIDTVQ